MASIITQPADVIKTGVQTSPHAGSVKTVIDICRSKGVRGMFAGVTPRVTRRTLMAAFTWLLYEQVGESLLYYNTLLSFYLSLSLPSIQIVTLVEDGFDRFQ